MQISDIFYHHKNMDMMNYIIWKYFYIFLFYLTCFTTVPILESIGPLVAEIWGGGGGQISPPPPQWTQVLEITQWE